LSRSCTPRGDAQRIVPALTSTLTEVYCFDTDVLSAVLRREPSLSLVRRLALVPPEEQFTTSITLGELLYGASKRGSTALGERVRELVSSLVRILPFDENAAEVYGALRARLELAGTPLGEPDLRIASIALANELTLVSGNVRHFSRVPDLRLENWLGRD
jgi:tRNA(fMet)-specific endonuclease VapC